MSSRIRALFNPSSVEKRSNIAAHFCDTLYLANTYGAEHLVVGSDYPLLVGHLHPVEEVKALELSPEAEDAILGGNASRLLRLDEDGRVQS